VTDRTRHARVGPAGGDGRIPGVGCQRTVAALAADLRVRVGFAEVGHIGMTVDACCLAGVGDRFGLILRQRTRPVGAEPAVVVGHQHRAQSEEQGDAHGEDRRQPKQMLV